MRQPCSRRCLSKHSPTLTNGQQAALYRTQGDLNVVPCHRWQRLRLRTLALTGYHAADRRCAGRDHHRRQRTGDGRCAFNHVVSVQGVGSGTALPVSGTVAATQSGAWNITNISGTVSLPTGASTSALQTTGNTALSTINTTLGSPFQAGGSIGNTTFASTQSGAWNITNVSGTVSLPTGAATAALQSGVQGTVGAGTAPANMVVGGGRLSCNPDHVIRWAVGVFQFDVNGNAKVVGQGIAQGSTTSGQAGSLIFGCGYSRAARATRPAISYPSHAWTRAATYEGQLRHWLHKFECP